MAETDLRHPGQVAELPKRGKDVVIVGAVGCGCMLYREDPAYFDAVAVDFGGEGAGSLMGVVYDILELGTDQVLIFSGGAHWEIDTVSRILETGNDQYTSG